MAITLYKNGKNGQKDRKLKKKKKKSKSNIPDNFDGTILLLLLVQTYYHYRKRRTFQNLTANILIISPTMTSIFKTLTLLHSSPV